MNELEEMKINAKNGEMSETFKKIINLEKETVNEVI